jgi:hypothetical protein
MAKCGLISRRSSSAGVPEKTTCAKTLRAGVQLKTVHTSPVFLHCRLHCSPSPVLVGGGRIELPVAAVTAALGTFPVVCADGRADSALRPESMPDSG